MAGRISLTYSELEQASTDLTKLSENINTILEDLIKQLSNLDWQGDDLDSYEASQKEIESSLVKLNGVLAGIATTINNAKIRYQETEQANKNRFA